MAGRFADRLTHRLPGFRDVARIMASGGFHTWRQPKGMGDAVPRVAARLPEIQEGEAAFTWVGHATYVVQMAGKVVLTDPVWTPRLPGFVRRVTPPGVALEEVLAKGVDAVVLSHNHYDHLDAWTLKRLPRGVAAFVPLGLARWFRRRGFTNVTELDWWQAADLDGLRFHFVPAHHWTRRALWDENDTLWGGWVLESIADGRKAYFAGDTAYGHWFKRIGERHPGIDVAMLPIGAYEPRWFMRNVHMDPDEAVRACLDLGARRLAAMHWATYVLTREPILQPPERARKAWAAAGRGPDDLWGLAIGDSHVLPRKGGAATQGGAAKVAPAARLSGKRASSRP